MLSIDMKYFFAFGFEKAIATFISICPLTFKDRLLRWLENYISRW